jgi:predicted enzyme related to lactoylglutathione lyase
MPDLKPIPGKFVWFEHVSKEPRKAQAFYGEVLGWKVAPFPMGNATYEMILTGEKLDTMIGGYAAPTTDRQPSHWISYVSVEDVDAAARAAAANGGRIVEAPHDIPTVGRSARIADPQGAQICPFKSNGGDPPDTPNPPSKLVLLERIAHERPGVLTGDANATAGRARKLGATMCIDPADIPGIGRFAVFTDPTGASVAILQPLPRQKQG